MATVNTRIESLEVDGSEVTARFSSTNPRSKFEIRLDGWATWKETSNPITLPAVKTGIRTLQVRSFNKQGQPDPTPASREFTVLASSPTPDPTPDPTPEPAPSNWQTSKVLRSIADWGGNKLIEGLDGATITDVNGQIRYFIPGPQTGERCETQTYFGKEGQLCAYDYSFYVPAATRLSTHYSGDPKNIITQHHGDKNAGYTGGVSIWPDGRIGLRIKGGKELDFSGSHRYENEEELVFGTYKRDTSHHVRLEILWKRDGSGYAKAQIDSQGQKRVDGPTWPVGDADGVPSTVIMYRHGWYPQGGFVEGNMDIRFGPLTFQIGNG